MMGTRLGESHRDTETSIHWRPIRNELISIFIPRSLRPPLKKGRVFYLEWRLPHVAFRNTRAK